MQPAVRTKAEIIARLQGHGAQLRALGVAQLGLFGSFVRDEAAPHSDVDLLVDFAEGRKTCRALCALGDYVEELVGRPVELLTRAGLSRYIGPHILPTTEDVFPAAFASHGLARSAGACGAKSGTFVPDITRNPVGVRGSA